MIRLDQFATGATKGIEDAITKAKDAGATTIVLDLRGNPGGYVNEAIGVASQFVGDGIVYQSVDRSGTEKDVPVQPGGLATEIPLVVLTDGNTASSAEIVTGAIQDADRGKVVGEKTFGTGTVLGRFDLSDGSSLRIGVERWLTRDGRPIWHEGLEPDVKVALGDTVAPLLPDDIRDMTAAQLAAQGRTQLLKALEVLKARRLTHGVAGPGRAQRKTGSPCGEPFGNGGGGLAALALGSPTCRLQLDVRPLTTASSRSIRTGSDLLDAVLIVGDQVLAGIRAGSAAAGRQPAAGVGRRSRDQARRCAKHALQ